MIARLVFVATLTSSLTLLGCTAPVASDGAVDTSSAALSGPSACPGTDWVSPDTWEGIAGSYSRVGAAPSDELTFLDVLAAPASPGAKVPDLRLVGGLAQFGQLLPMPSNPLIGPGLVFFDAAGAKVIDVYFTPLLARDRITQHVTRICAVYGSASDRKPFLLTRMGI